MRLNSRTGIEGRPHIHSLTTPRYFRYRFTAHLNETAGCGRQVRVGSCETPGLTGLHQADLEPLRHIVALRRIPKAIAAPRKHRHSKHSLALSVSLSARIFTAFPRIDNRVFSVGNNAIWKVSGDRPTAARSVNCIIELNIIH